MSHLSTHIHSHQAKAVKMIVVAKNYFKARLRLRQRDDCWNWFEENSHIKSKRKYHTSNRAAFTTKTYAHTSRNKKKHNRTEKKSFKKIRHTENQLIYRENFSAWFFFSLSNLWFLTKRYIRRVKKNCVRTQENKSFSLEYWGYITGSKYIFHVNIFRSSLRNAWIRIEKKFNSINSERTQNVLKEKI